MAQLLMFHELLQMVKQPCMIHCLIIQVGFFIDSFRKEHMFCGVQVFFTSLKNSFTGECTEETTFTTIHDVFMFVFFGNGQIQPAQSVLVSSNTFVPPPQMSLKTMLCPE
jgi:hypothetical protein